MAYTFFDNYHQAAAEYAGGNLETYGRLMMILNTYAIDGETLPDLSPVEKLFLAGIKPSIDKSNYMREIAKKGGRVTKEQRLQARLQAENKPAYNEIEIEIEKELEKEEEVEIVRNYDSILTTFLQKNNFTIREPAYSKIIKRMKPMSSPETLLDNHLEYVKGRYPSKSGKELEALFIKSFEWENIFPSLQAEEKPKPKKDYHKGAPKVCTFCGAKLTKWAGINIVSCPTCSETKKTFWELEKNEWLCNRTE